MLKPLPTHLLFYRPSRTGILLLVWFLLHMVSCRPEALDAQWETLDSGTTETLTEIWLSSDGTGWLTGGTTWTRGSIRHTADGGKTWETALDTDKLILDLTCNPDGWCAAGGIDGRIWIHEPGSADWKLWRTDQWSIIRGIAGPGPDSLVAACGESLIIGSVYRVTADQQIHDLHLFENRLEAAVHVQRGRFLALGYGVVQLSEDAGRTWSPLDLVGDLFMAACFPEPDLGFMVGYGGSILRSTDGGQHWTYLREGDDFLVSDTPFRDVFFLDRQIGVLAGDAGTAWWTQDGGASWQRLTGLPRSIDWHTCTIHDGQIYLGGSGGHLVRSPLPF